MRFVITFPTKASIHVSEKKTIHRLAIMCTIVFVTHAYVQMCAFKRACIIISVFTQRAIKILISTHKLATSNKTFACTLYHTKI